MKIICIGRNYAAHIEELSNEKPKDPVIFLKPDSAVLQKNTPFYIPEFSNNIHYEVEILVKIDKIGKYIEPAFAHKYYNQISLGIDFTARDLQTELKTKGLPWEKAKGFDNSALIGEWVDKSSFKDINEISFSLKKNNSLVQQGNTNLMLWKIDEIVSYVSQFFTLKIGDVIFTGTPSGVGKIDEGDLLEGFIENKKYFSLPIK